LIELKTKPEILILKETGDIVSEILSEIVSNIKPGITTKHIEEIADKLFKKNNVQPAFKGYLGYPGSICVSINEELVHGIPSRNKIVKDNDIVKIDVGIKHKGFYGDVAQTVSLGNTIKENKDLLQVTYDSFENIKKYANKYCKLGDISASVQEHVESYGYSVIRDFVGHGIGRNLHEKPEIPNFGKHSTGPNLMPGMVFAVEPMVTIGSWEVNILEDGWTVVTKDKKCCAHFEHMLAITENGCEMLTKITNKF